MFVRNGPQGPTWAPKTAPGGPQKSNAHQNGHKKRKPLWLTPGFFAPLRCHEKTEESTVKAFTAHLQQALQPCNR
eukprot:8777642-Pyramimonas_sp.AAC.1